MKIRILVTGGTFDKEYDELKQALSFKKTHLPQVLGQGRSKLDVKVQTLMLIDSLEMDESHRMRLLETCNSCPEKKIAITHGTDTMPETARFLAGKVKGKTIVLTGAMVPYVFGSSDGLFNLGAALAFVQSLPQGVYVTMNGKVFNAGSVRKNLKTGEFELVE